MNKTLILVALAVSMVSGCGYVDRMSATATGGGAETCVDGVKYLQFTSGATVKYNRDGSIATCD